jgi:hypothetical protein
VKAKAGPLLEPLPPLRSALKLEDLESVAEE